MTARDSQSGPRARQTEHPIFFADPAGMRAPGRLAPECDGISHQFLNEQQELDATEADWDQNFADFWSGHGSDWEAKAAEAEPHIAWEAGQ